jgi:thiol-disulfide isomerase/thioredoxin
MLQTNTNIRKFSTNLRSAAIQIANFDRMNRMLRDHLLGLLAVGALSTNLWAFNEKLPKALSFKPRQSDVNYDKVSPADVEKCSLEEVKRNDGEGFWITGPGGQPLRWFVDTNGDKKPDRWSYYGGGVEVYRESDTNFNGTADEFRWLNTEGMRWGVDENEDGKIDRWRAISAEEVTAEVIRAIATNDRERFERLLLTDKEIKSLALGESLSNSVKSRVKSAQEKFSTWMKQQTVVSASSVWTNFGADKPGIVPAGTENSTKDVVAYENAVALFSDNGEAKQLIVGTMIQVDGAWRLASLPRIVGDNSSTEESGVFWQASYSGRSGTADAETNSNSGMSKAMEALVNQMQDIDKKIATESDKNPWHAKRADLLEKMISSSETAAEQTNWIEQFADTVSAAAQVGEYTDGIERLQDFVRKLQEANASSERVAYVAFRTLTAEHNVKMQLPNAKFDDLNETYLGNLKKFIEEYPTAKDSGEAILQIALAAELTGDAKDATKWYSQAAKTFASSDAGKRASGAMNRLGLEGKPFSITLPTLDGRTFKSSEYRDGPVIYHFWASNCPSCKTDMRALKELQATYAKSKLKIVGVNLDKTPETGVAFLKDINTNWVNVHDKGGMDSQLALTLGIQVLPMNFVVDKDGKVVKTSVHWTDLEKIIDELVK